MGALKKYKKNFPLEDQTKKSSQNADKKAIDAYIKKIEDLMNDPEKQKKAALIISQLINSKK